MYIQYSHVYNTCIYMYKLPFLRIRFCICSKPGIFTCISFNPQIR